MFCEVLEAVVNIVGQACEGAAGDLAAAGAVVPEDEGETRDHHSDFVVVEVRASAGTEGGDSFRLQGGQEMAAVVQANTVEQEGYLAVVVDHAGLPEERGEISEAFAFILFGGGVDAEHGGVVWVFYCGIGRNGFLVAEGQAVGVGPVGGCHPGIV